MGTFLAATPLGDSFSIENLIAAIGQFVTYIFGSDGPVLKVLDVVTENQILWVFLAFGICTIGINVLRRLRSIF